MTRNATTSYFCARLRQLSSGVPTHRAATALNSTFSPRDPLRNIVTSLFRVHFSPDDNPGASHPALHQLRSSKHNLLTHATHAKSIHTDRRTSQQQQCKPPNKSQCRRRPKSKHRCATNRSWLSSGAIVYGTTAHQNTDCCISRSHACMTNEGVESLPFCFDNECTHLQNDREAASPRHRVEKTYSKY